MTDGDAKDEQASERVKAEALLQQQARDKRRDELEIQLEKLNIDVTQYKRWLAVAFSFIITGPAFLIWSGWLDDGRNLSDRTLSNGRWWYQLAWKQLPDTLFPLGIVLFIIGLIALAAVVFIWLSAPREFLAAKTEWRQLEGYDWTPHKFMELK